MYNFVLFLFVVVCNIISSEFMRQDSFYVLVVTNFQDEIEDNVENNNYLCV